MVEQDKASLVNILQTVMEIYGKTFNGELIGIWWEMLKDYDISAIRIAFNQHAKTSEFAPVPASIITLLPDLFGYLSPDEAWESLPKFENEGGYVTQQAMSAAPFNLIDSGDMVAARMAFKDAYKREVITAKSQGIKPNYFYSAPTDGSREQKQQIKSSSLLIARTKEWISEQRYSDLNNLLDQPISQNNPALNMLSLHTENGLKKIGKKSSKPTAGLN